MNVLRRFYSIFKDPFRAIFHLVEGTGCPLPFRRNACGFLFRALETRFIERDYTHLDISFYGASEVTLSVLGPQRRACGYARPQDSLPALPSRESAVRDVVCTSSDGS